MSENGLIATATEFRESVKSVMRRYEHVYKGLLEEYLRGVLVSISKNQSKNPSYSQFAVILEEAFQVTPRPFDNAWLQHTVPPANRLQQAILETKSKAYGFNLPKGETKTKEVADFECLYQTVLFQIAELNRFGQKKPAEYGKYTTYAKEFKSLGLKSPTGHEWCNWDPFTYLECATAGLEDHAQWMVPEFKEGNSWAVLACLLEWGRMYE